MIEQAGVLRCATLAGHKSEGGIAQAGGLHYPGGCRWRTVGTACSRVPAWRAPGPGAPAQDPNPAAASTSAGASTRLPLLLPAAPGAGAGGGDQRPAGGMLRPQPAPDVGARPAGKGPGLTS